MTFPDGDRGKRRAVHLAGTVIREGVQAYRVKTRLRRENRGIHNNDPANIKPLSQVIGHKMGKRAEKMDASSAAFWITQAAGCLRRLLGCADQTIVCQRADRGYRLHGTLAGSSLLIHSRHSFGAIDVTNLNCSDYRTVAQRQPFPFLLIVIFLRLAKSVFIVSAYDLPAMLFGSIVKIIGI